MIRLTKKLLLIVFIFTAALESFAENDSYLIAQTSKRKRSSKKRSKSKRRRVNPIAKVKKMALAGNYKEASKLLFSLSRSSKYKKDAAQIKYMLGLMLTELELYQTASFVFYDVIDESIKNPGSRRYLKQSLGKLSYLSNKLDSDVLLKYAVSRIRIKDFPVESRDLFFYRYGELKLRESKFGESVRSFAKVNDRSSVYPMAMYKRGLAYTESGNLKKAVQAFSQLLNHYSKNDVTNPNRVSALMGLARVYYQAKKWEKSIEYYRQVPRDTKQWHDALFEMSWAMFRSGKYFRSALSNFHSLHSSYYAKVYNPESLLLRAIIYLYICRYDEMEKVIELFEKFYKPVQRSIEKMLSRSTDGKLYWDEVKRGLENQKRPKDDQLRMRLDQLVIDAILKETLIKSNIKYYSMLENEERIVQSLGARWKTSSVGKFARKIVKRRKKSTESLVGKLSRNYLIKMKSELRDFFEQADFLKFEMVSGKKEIVAKKIVGKDVPRKSILDNNSRSFFIANGFEYWPFQGEYWLDELGNYHYVGVQACK